MKTSISNHLTGIISNIECDADISVVSVKVADSLIKSLMTTNYLKQLNCTVGDGVTVITKASNVILIGK